MFLYIIIPSIIFILVDNFFNMNILLIFKSLIKLSKIPDKTLVDDKFLSINP